VIDPGGLQACSQISDSPKKTQNLSSSTVDEEKEKLSYNLDAELLGPWELERTKSVTT
jgi:hypothetical protein